MFIFINSFTNTPLIDNKCKRRGVDILPGVYICCKLEFNPYFQILS